MTSEALSRLISLCSQPVKNETRRHLTMGPCGLLEAAVQSHEAVASAQQLQTKLPSLNQLPSRVELIKAYHDRKVTADELLKAVHRVIEVTRNAWKYKPTAEMTALNTSLKQTSVSLDKSHRQTAGEPSFLTSLKGGKKDNKQERLVKVLLQFGAEDEVGWTHPGWQLAGGMLAALSAKKLPEPEYKIETVVMFAAHHPTHPS